MKDWIKPQGDAVSLSLVIQPRASKNEIVGEFGNPTRLKIRITAPPVDSAANEAIIAFLAEKLGVPKRSLEILRGQTGKQKTVLCRGTTLCEALSRLVEE
jgi:uncharacterized protein (TIGR00251 family)